MNQFQNTIKKIFIIIKENYAPIQIITESNIKNKDAGNTKPFWFYDLYIALWVTLNS